MMTIPRHGAHASVSLWRMRLPCTVQVLSACLLRVEVVPLLHTLGRCCLRGIILPWSSVRFDVGTEVHVHNCRGRVGHNVHPPTVCATLLAKRGALMYVLQKLPWVQWSVSTKTWRMCRACGKKTDVQMKTRAHTSEQGTGWHFKTSKSSYLRPHLLLLVLQVKLLRSKHGPRS